MWLALYMSELMNSGRRIRSVAMASPGPLLAEGLV